MNCEISQADQLDYKIKTLEFKLERLQLRLPEDAPKTMASQPPGTSSTANPPLTAQPLPRTIVTTANGRIRGAKRRSIYGHTYYAYERIPYAQPPVGELRFRAPKPLGGKWTGVRDCTQYGERPFQRLLGDGRVGGTEDCLHLNIYTNNPRPTGRPRPVMVWIYGGGFVCGEANPEWYGPDHFMAKEVVLVTVQYRVGALGFLSLQDPRQHIPGNAGIKDQILALKWLRRNCPSFGGNPQCITVFGESAGAISTHLLMLSEQGRGLFQRAIMQSGAATMQLPSYACDRHSAHTLAMAAGYSGPPGDREVVRYLQQECTAAQIVVAEARCGAEAAGRGERFMFGICVEPFVGPHTVLAQHPDELLAHAWGNSIPLLVGGTTNEGVFFLPLARRCLDMSLQQLDTCAAYVPRQAAVNAGSAECREKGLRLRRLHVRGDTPTLEDYAELISYSFFWHPMQRAIEARLHPAPPDGGQFGNAGGGGGGVPQLSSSTAPPSKVGKTFLYRYDFASSQLQHPFGLMGELSTSTLPGVAHTAELGALFHSAVGRRCEPQTREYRHIEQMIAIWTAFAATGSPNAAFQNEDKHFWSRAKPKQRLWWPAVRPAAAEVHSKFGCSKRKGVEEDGNAGAWQCLNIDDELRVIDLPEMAKLRVWSGLYVPARGPPLPANADDSELRIRLQSSL